MAGVPRWGGTKLHQPGLSQLWTHQSEPQRPWTIQLWGCSGVLFIPQGFYQACRNFISSSDRYTLHFVPDHSTHCAHHTEPFHPSHVTQANEWESTEEQKERDEKNNDGVCLCQVLMRQVMAWIGCSVSSPWFQSGLVMCNMQRLSLAGHYSALSHRTSPPVSACSVCPQPPDHTCIYALHWHNQTSIYLSYVPHQSTHTHLFFLSLAGAHFQVNEKWQLCTLFAIQHLPRPPVSQKEGELHPLTQIISFFYKPLSVLLHFPFSFDFYVLKDTSGPYQS